MKSLWINAPAKINLALDVLSKRSDGYHEVRMIMQSIRLFDKLTLEKTDVTGISLETNLGFLPCDENNLVYQAAKMMMEDYELDGGLHIFLDKHIPVAAGMAGGSTDAASCMLAINHLYSLRLSEQTLMEKGVTLGADIPYCIMKGTALAEGIGEKLTPLPAAPECYVLIAKPNSHVSTKTIYTNLDALENPTHPDIDTCIHDIHEFDIYSLCRHMGNILEDVTIPEHPEIAQIKETMMEHGAIGAMMSGSGPTVFGLFDNENAMFAAKEACKALPYFVFVFHTDFYR